LNKIIIIVRNFHFAIFILLTLFVASCKQKEKTYRGPIFDRSTTYLFNKMKANEFQYDWLTTKFSAEITEGGKKNTLKATVKTKNDSVIWVSIAPSIGIEVVRAKITKDTISFINRINSTYFVGDYKYLSKNFGIELDYDMIQSVLTGNAFSSYEEEEFKSFVDKDQYLLSTVRKRKLRRSIQRNDSLDMIAQSIWLEPRIYKIAKFAIYDFGLNRNLEINYDNFTLVGEQLFPYKVSFSLSGDIPVPVQLNLQYSKVAHDTPQNLPFTIPEKYEPLK
jgi:hypothetical protein